MANITGGKYVHTHCDTHGWSLGSAEALLGGSKPTIFLVDGWCGCQLRRRESDVTKLYGFSQAEDLAVELVSTEEFAIYSEMEKNGFKPGNANFSKLQLIKMVNIRLRNLRQAKASVEFAMYRVWLRENEGKNIQVKWQKPIFMYSQRPAVMVVPGELSQSGRIKAVCLCGCNQELSVELPSNAPKVENIGIPEIDFDKEEEETLANLSLTHGCGGRSFLIERNGTGHRVQCRRCRFYL